MKNYNNMKADFMCLCKKEMYGVSYYHLDVFITWTMPGYFLQPELRLCLYDTQPLMT